MHVLRIRSLGGSACRRSDLGEIESNVLMTRPWRTTKWELAAALTRNTPVTPMKRVVDLVGVLEHFSLWMFKGKAQCREKHRCVSEILGIVTQERSLPLLLLHEGRL